jgi:hypothetical protein
MSNLRFPPLIAPVLARLVRIPIQDILRQLGGPNASDEVCPRRGTVSGDPATLAEQAWAAGADSPDGAEDVACYWIDYGGEGGC